MGAVTRYTGISEHTLRAWERRFGFPQPKRLPSGHRRYTTDQVRQLVLISTLLSSGYRAGDVVPLPREDLEALLEERGVIADSSDAGSRREWIESVFHSARHFDRNAILSKIHQDASRYGLPRLMRESIGPLVDAMGLEWARGRLAVRHEHFISEVVEDALRVIRAPLEASTRGRPVVLAGLEGELHGLGLHLVAITIALGGRSLRMLGPNTPPRQVVETAITVNAVAVALSVSAFANEKETYEQLVALRDRLPAEIPIWVGGAGAIGISGLPAGIKVLANLDDLHYELGQLAAG
jgi:hypothetical protein